MYSNLPRDWTRFYQLGTCECKCFRLAGIAITEGDLRQELIETLATGEYSDFSDFSHSFVVVTQAPVFQVLALDTE